ncbi:nuclease-related domain-containing protein [Mycobacterium sp. 1423905.2]|uniref:nuclease-related domain-containing protein n=1 Tax=Mycobacterium sp. 1423905.2 TaxID=1856859 RepID=UPI0007FE0F5D|nr:nuclease-related domain-containing protein [Mycobacterium sp. 1423905.2]OBJ53412.1 hypothetical protein A9W95_18290 [Mycobacterium sp. 1423905.2]
MKIVPPIDRFGTIQSAAEARVAKLLHQVDLGEPATCFYSVHMPRHEYKRMAEIDFLVVMKGVMLVIEVKGGRISRRDGLWVFTDRYGDSHEKREGPFEQARTAMYALKNTLQHRIRGLASAFGAVVITPDQVLDPDIEWDPVEYIGPTAMTVGHLQTSLRAAARHWRAQNRQRPAENEYQQILKVVRPDFDRIPRLSLLAHTFEADYVALAREQYDMLRGCETNTRIFCTGGAGSGKTLLAVETARRASADGAKVLLTCRSTGVIDVMRKSLSGSEVTCLPWSQISGSPPFDVIVVDEAQDIMSVDDCLKLDQLVVGGLADGRWRIFCDPNNQANVDGSFDQSIFEELKSQGVQYTLPYNCRNTSAVVQQTQLLTGADLGVAKAGHGPAVEYVKPASDEDAAALLDARLKQFRQQDVDLSDIVVVTLRDDVKSSSAVKSKAFARRQLIVADPTHDTTSAGIAKLTTAQQIKGLEAPHVLVVDVDDVANATGMARFYVAMTRPRISLWLAVNPRAWHQLIGDQR